MKISVNDIELYTLSETQKTETIYLQPGYLGRLFGVGEHAIYNICGMIIFLLIVAGIITSFINTIIEPIDYWKTIAPIIATIIGFFLGKNRK